MDFKFQNIVFQENLKEQILLQYTTHLLRNKLVNFGKNYFI